MRHPTRPPSRNQVFDDDDEAPLPDYTNVVLPFGRHRGQRARDLSDSFLCWLVANGVTSGIVRSALLQELAIRQVAGLFATDRDALRAAHVRAKAPPAA